MNSHFETDRFLKVRGGVALAGGNFGFVKGLPAVDAVYFPNGEPPRNLSLKSLRDKNTPPYNFFNLGIRSAIRSIVKNYSARAYAKLFDLDLVDEVQASLRALGGDVDLVLLFINAIVRVTKSKVELSRTRVDLDRRMQRDVEQFVGLSRELPGTI